MTPWQITQTIKARLLARTWPAAGGEKVFGQVWVVPALLDALFLNGIKPVVGIKAAAASDDQENQNYLTQPVEMILIVDLPGDEIGENAITGANRADLDKTSKGRGLLEVEAQLKAALRSLKADGIRLLMKPTSSTEAALADNRPFAAYRTYSVDAFCTVDLYYHPPRNLVATPGGGAISLSWTLPPDRYDRRRMILRRAVGGVPPATPTSGTGVTLGSDLATSVVDSPGAGTYSYALFAAYDETGSGTDEQFSAQETGTTRASVVLP